MGAGARRILFCESNSDGTVGGSHRCLLHLVENVDRARFTPLVVFCEPHSLMPQFRAAAETFVLRRRPPVRWGSDGRRGLGAGVESALMLPRKAVNALKASSRVVEHIRFMRRHRIDLVHLNNSITRHHDVMVAALIARVPVMCHERGLPSYSWSDRLLARRLALIIPASKWIRDRMVEQRVSPVNIRVMYDGLDPGRLAPVQSPAAVRAAWNLRPDQGVVGIVGNLREWKGQEVVVRALIEVVKRGHDVVCFFVGASTPEDEPYVSRLHALIAEAGIERQCRFTGYERDVASLVHTMDFVIHASVKPEPFGMVVLEAMAQRKAIIGSRAGGITEIVVDGETGYTFPPGNWQALAASMAALLSDPSLARLMGENGYRRLSTDFALQPYVDGVQTAYENVLAGRSAVTPTIGARTVAGCADGSSADKS